MLVDVFAAPTEPYAPTDSYTDSATSAHAQSHDANVAACDSCDSSTLILKRCMSRRLANVGKKGLTTEPPTNPEAATYADP